jgi:hypothetical protein
MGYASFVTAVMVAYTAPRYIESVDVHKHVNLFLLGFENEIAGNT